MNRSVGHSAIPSPTEIRRARRQARLTAAQAAALVHATPGKWAKWETGVHRMQAAAWELFVLKSRAVAARGEPRSRARRAGGAHGKATPATLPEFAAVVERRALQWAASACEATMTTAALEKHPGVRAADWNAACAQCAENVRALIPKE